MTLFDESLQIYTNKRISIKISLKNINLPQKWVLVALACSEMKHRQEIG